MPKSIAWSTELLRQILTEKGMGLPDALWCSLHFRDPARNDKQGEGEAGHAGYKRISLPRTPRTWVIADGEAVLREKQDFDECTAGARAYTHFGIGTKSSGAGQMLYTGALLQPLKIYAGRLPRLLPGTKIVEH